MPKISISSNNAINFTRSTCQKLRFCTRPRPPPISTTLVPTPDQIAHLVLDQKSPTEALETFRWASKIPNFAHTNSTYRALVHKLCTFRRFDTAKQLLDEMPSSINSAPDDDVFVTLIRGLGRAKMVKEVINVLDLVSKYKKVASLKVYNSILDVLVKEDIDIAREFYRQKMNGTGDDFTYGILMKGLCLTNRIGDAFKLLQVMKTGDVKPNCVVYNTLMHCLCKNGKVGRARSLMSEMREFNDVTFNILISAYCSAGDSVQALVMLEKCFSYGFAPDVVTVTKVVDILCNAGRAAEAAEVLERVEGKGGKIDVVAYNTLIKGFCRLGKVKIGRRILKEMEVKGCLPNVDSYNLLIAGFCQSRMLDLALDMFDEMKRVGINWNFVTFDTVIRGLCSEGRTEDGYKVLELMEESKGDSAGRISPYNSIIYGLYKENRTDEALEFLKKMSKLFPRAVSRSLSILALCYEHSIEDAKRVFDQMIGEGDFPSALVYVNLIHGFCRKECIREAFELLNEMVSHGYFPVSSTFNAIISGLCRQGKSESALKLMEDIICRGCVPDAGTYSPLVNALCRKGDFHAALMLFLQMVEKNIIPDYHSWNSLVLCLSQGTQWSSDKNLIRINVIFQLNNRDISYLEPVFGKDSDTY